MRDGFRTYVVVNPRSAGGATAKRCGSLEKELSAVLDDFVMAQTTAPGDATTMTREALRQGYEMIVAVGGDGTIHEVVNGFFENGEKVASSPVLGLIPAGTGGDYRKTWGLSRTAEDAIARLAGRETKTVDAGCVTWGSDSQTRYFANIASVGLGGAVSKQANEQSKFLGGKASFFIASARTLMRYRNRPLEIITDGGEPRRAEVTVAAFCIGRFFGGGMMIGPNADPADGLFDVVTIEGASRMKMVAMTSIYKGKHLSDPKVAFWQGRCVEVREQDGGDGQTLIEADGEVFGSLPARFEVIPSAFRLKVLGP